MYKRLLILGLIALSVSVHAAKEVKYTVQFLNYQRAVVQTWTCGADGFEIVEGGVIVDCNECRDAWYGPYRIYLSSNPKPKSFSNGKLPAVKAQTAKVPVAKPKPIVAPKGAPKPPPEAGSIGEAFSQSFDDFTLPSTK